MKNKKNFLTKISDIDSNLKNNRFNFNNCTQHNVIKKFYCSDKSAIEDYKNLKSEISDLNFEMSPKKLAYQKIRIRNFHNK